jgi:hypothetical protein
MLSSSHFALKFPVFIPAQDEGSPGEWTFLADCVWDAPNWFRHRHRLSANVEYHRVKVLFTEILKVPDATLENFFGYLIKIKESESYIFSDHDRINIELLYDQLHALAKDEDIQIRIRYVNS